MFLFLNASPKLIVTEKRSLTPSIITLKLLATNESCDITQFEIFSHVGGSKRSRINLKSDNGNLKWVNLKYKTDCLI